MSKHRHQSKEERISNKTHEAAALLREKLPFKASEPMKSEVIQGKAFVGDSAIQLRAYQIYSEKGGSALDNWLEAERILNADDPLDHALTNMGSAEVYN